MEIIIKLLQQILESKKLDSVFNVCLIIIGVACGFAMAVIVHIMVNLDNSISLSNLVFLTATLSALSYILYFVIDEIMSC